MLSLLFLAMCYHTENAEVMNRGCGVLLSLLNNEEDRVHLQHVAPELVAPLLVASTMRSHRMNSSIQE